MFWRLVPLQNALDELDHRKVSVPAVLKLHFILPSGSRSASIKVDLKTPMLLCSSRASQIRAAHGTSFLSLSRASASNVSLPVFRLFFTGNPNIRKNRSFCCFAE